MLSDDEILKVCTDAPLADTGRGTLIAFGRAIEAAAIAKHPGASVLHDQGDPDARIPEQKGESVQAYVLACPSCGASMPPDEVQWDGAEGAPADFGKCPKCGATSEADEWVEAEDEPGDWAKELGPLQQGDIELLEDAIEALLPSAGSLQRDHALHGLRRRVEVAKALAVTQHTPTGKPTP